MIVFAAPMTDASDASASSAPTFVVILAGGGGTRLWPASRRRRPKQLLRFGGAESLLGAAFRRARGFGTNTQILVVTAADQEEQIRAELPDLGRDGVLVEPEPRNTAAAVGLAAAAVIRRAGPTAKLAILPADPFIADEGRFLDAARAALAHASDAIVTIGLRPAHPETGFGYIRLGAPVAGPSGPDGPVRAAAEFVEKPTRARAESYVASGEYLWNSGMFFLTAGRMMEEARRHLPALGEALDACVAAPDFATAVRARYGAVPSISIDHGIMEKAKGIRVVSADFGWNDVGSWAALPVMRAADDAGNVVVGACAVEDSRGAIVMSDDGGPFVGVVGVDNLVVVATKDAVLVIPKDRAQDVRQIVEAAKRLGRTDLL